LAQQPDGEVSFTQAKAAGLAWEAFDAVMRDEGPGHNPPDQDPDGQKEGE